MSERMTCREILDNLSAFIDEELDPRLCDEIQAHMDGCSPCVAFLNTLKKTVVLFKNCGEGEQLPQEVHIDLHRFLRRACQEAEEET